jgi:predicted transcriptional regulator
MSKQVNIRLDDASIATLDAVGQATGRSRSALVQRAIDTFVAREQRHIEAVKCAIAQADAGQGLPAEQVFDDIDAWIKSTLPDVAV